MLLKRRSIVPVDSSAARIPRPLATMALAILDSSLMVCSSSTDGVGRQVWGPRAGLVLPRVSGVAAGVWCCRGYLVLPRVSGVGAQLRRCRAGLVWRRESAVGAQVR